MASERAIGGDAGRPPDPVRRTARTGRVHSTAPVAQRLAQQRLAGLLEMAEVRTDQSYLRLSLTRGTTELPTWLDTLGVPYQVGTERRRPSTHSGPLDVVILIAWSDLPALARWIPTVAARLQAQQPSRFRRTPG